jgi:CHAD domain-containing protein
MGGGHDEREQTLNQMRVAVRRLRASLSTFAPMLPPDQRRWASQELRWLADALGEARNLDVFSGSLLPPARAALPDASEFERLSQAAERRRRDAHAGVVQAIGSTRYTEALLALFRWLDGPDWRSTGDAAPCDEPIEKLAPLLLDRCRAQAEKRATDFVKQSPRKRHRLRIALKKLRYAAEMLGSLYDAAATRVFIQRLKRMQDDLGDANDVSVARDIIKSLAPDRRSTGIAYAGHRMLAWHNQRLAESEPRTRQHLSELLAATPFWPVTES